MARSLTLALALLLTAGAMLSAQPLSPANWTDGYVFTNGIRIHYWRTGGNKPVMIMAHGSSDDGLCWTNFAKEFEGAYEIIMFDARGHGLSDPPKPSNEPDAMVDDLAGLIRELKITKPIVMGHSMGSATAAWFGAKYPDVARAIVLEDPGLVRRAPMPNAAADVEKRRAGILARNNMTYQQLVDECAKGSPKWGRSECETWAPSKRRHHPDTALVNIGSRPPMRELFPKITVPVLILKADAQGDLRRENEEVTALLPNGKIVHIAGAGHNVRREGKDQAVAATKEFLAGL